VTELERALDLFSRLGMPLDTGRTRLLLAMEVTATQHDVAVAEARLALSVFEELGAAPDADAAAAFLRSIGVKAARSGPRGLGVLTKREREVLELLAEGATNRQIAERLFLSPKTAEHHVRSVLAKLDLSNRAEAAAYAVRHPETNSATK
jgi:DNA-binding NarL/FixJ family response regulator